MYHWTLSFRLTRSMTQRWSEDYKHYPYTTVMYCHMNTAGLYTNSVFLPPTNNYCNGDSFRFLKLISFKVNLFLLIYNIDVLYFHNQSINFLVSENCNVNSYYAAFRPKKVQFVFSHKDKTRRFIFVGL